jgi:exosortase
MLAMVGGLALHALGFVAEQARVSIIGLLIFAWGVMALGGGSRWARASAFPLAFLVFAIPVNALDSVGFWLRMWVVDVSALLAHGFGIGVIKNGTQLLAPDGSYDYDVAAACSGVRSLTAIAALSLFVGYLRFRPLWLRCGFLALSVPFIVVGNVARVVAIVLAARFGGSVWGDRVHEVMGYGVFAIVLVGMYVVAESIAGRHPEWICPSSGPLWTENPAAGPSDSPHPWWHHNWNATIVVLASGLSAGAFLEHVSRAPETGRTGIVLAADGRSPVELPTFLGTEWIGRSEEVTEIEREVLPSDTGFSRKTYVSIADPTKSVFLSIVLSGRDRSSIHRPELCLVGQGWTIRGSSIHQFEYGASGGFPARVLRVEKEIATPKGRVRVPQIVAYYFLGDGIIVASNWERIVHDAWNRVAHGRADRWAYVLLQTGDSDGDAAALARIQEILNDTLPHFEPSNGL